MYILDTDHISLHQRKHGLIEHKITTTPKNLLFTTIISYQEQIAGRLAVIRRAKTPNAQIIAYQLLHEARIYFCNRSILPFDADAQRQFSKLKAAKIRVGTNDLKIASIALAYNGTVLTRNMRDFRQVPNLRIEDWSQPSA